MDNALRLNVRSGTMIHANRMGSGDEYGTPICMETTSGIDAAIERADEQKKQLMREHGAQRSSVIKDWFETNKGSFIRIVHFAGRDFYQSVRPTYPV